MLIITTLDMFLMKMFWFLFEKCQKIHQISIASSVFYLYLFMYFSFINTNKTQYKYKYNDINLMNFVIFSNENQNFFIRNMLNVVNITLSMFRMKKFWFSFEKNDKIYQIYFIIFVFVLYFICIYIKNT